MRLKFILTLLITLFTLHFANAQSTTDRVQTLEIIRLVSDANFKLNSIYRERVSGHESEQQELRNAIYAANTELMSTRSLLSGIAIIKTEKSPKVRKAVVDLQTAIDAVEISMSDVDLKKSINHAKSMAKKLKKTVSRLKK